MPSRPHPVAMAGVVLCGGASRRFGSDKAAASFEGERLVERAARRLATVADPVVVASGVPGRLGPLPWPEVGDAAHDKGPLAGLVAGLAASRRPLVAVVAADMPFIDVDLLTQLAAALEQAGDAVHAALARTVRGIEPLHAVYRRTALPALEAALDGDELALHRAMRRLNPTYVDVEDDRFAININRPGDLARLREGT